MNTALTFNKLIDMISTDLRQLSCETRKKYGNIKEVAEAALLKLRELSCEQTESEEKLVDLALEIINPFILGCETEQARLIQLSLTAIHRIVQYAIVNDESVVKIANLLSNLADMKIEEVRLIQTSLLLVNGTKKLRHNDLSKALVLGLKMCLSKDITISNTSNAAVKQIVIAVFERIPESSAEDPDMLTCDICKSADPSEFRSHYVYDALMLFKDLCHLLSGEQPEWLVTINELPTTICLDLLETILSKYPDLILMNPDLKILLKSKICPQITPLLISSFDKQRAFVEFSVTSRVMKVVLALVQHYLKNLEAECEIFLSLVVKYLEPEKIIWQRALGIETMHKLFTLPNVIRSLCTSYDMRSDSTNVLKDTINGISSFVQSLFLNQGSKSADVNNEISPTFVYKNIKFFLAQKYNRGQAKSHYLDYWDRECPAISENYCITIGFFTILEISHCISQIRTYSEMDDACFDALIESSWCGVLSSLSFLLDACVDDATINELLKAYVTLTLSSASQSTARKAFIIALCKLCLPSFYMINCLSRPDENSSFASESKFPVSGEIPDVNSQYAALTGSALTFSAANTITVTLTFKNIHCVNALLSVALHCISELDSSWLYVIATLQHLTWIFGFRPLASSGALAFCESSGSVVSSTAVMSDLVSICSTISMLFRNSRDFTDEKVINLIETLKGVALECLEAMQLSNKLSAMDLFTARNRFIFYSNLADCECTRKEFSLRSPCLFAVSKLAEVGFNNLHRINIWWTLVMDHLFYGIECQNIKLREFYVDTLCILVRNALEFCSDTSKYTLILSPLEKLSSISYSDVRLRQLDTLLFILHTHGHSLCSAWPLVLSSCDAVHSDHSDYLVRLAFSCVELTVNDFLPSFPFKYLGELLQVIANFAQRHDVNTSLTALGLIWNIGDFLSQQNSFAEDTWMKIYSYIAKLCIDKRPAVRKSSSQTLFTTISTYGSLLSSKSWQSLIWEVLFELISSLEIAFSSASEQDPNETSEILIHHSRDTAEKQWAESVFLNLLGVTRVIATTNILFTLNDFPDIWMALLDKIGNAAMSKNAEVNYSALQALSELTSSPMDFIDLWLKLWKVWLSIDIRSSHNYPSQNFLKFYIDLFISVSSKIWSHFTSNDFHTFASIVEKVLSVPIYIDSVSFIMQTDSNLTPLQESCLNSFYHVAKMIQDTPQMQYVLLPSLIHRCLLMSNYAVHPLQVEVHAPASVKGLNGTSITGTFVSFGESLLNFVAELYDTYAFNPVVIEYSILQAIIQSLRAPLSMKYDCPSCTTWQLAIQHFLNITKRGMSVVVTNESHFRGMWDQLIATMDAFLFNKSPIPSDLTIQQLQSNEAIDCQVIDMIRDDILSVPEVLPPSFIEQIFSLLSKGSIYSTSQSDSFIDMDSVRIARDEFSKACFSVILQFSLNDGKSDMAPVTRLSLFTLLRRCKDILQQYINDERINGKYPMSRSRNCEVLSVIGAINKVLSDLKTKEELNGVTVWKIVASLYPSLVECTASKNEEIASCVRVTLHKFLPFFNL